eukprot:3524701-Pyramimonas_sp.AAC.1
MAREAFPAVQKRTERNVPEDVDPRSLTAEEPDGESKSRRQDAHPGCGNMQTGEPSTTEMRQLRSSEWKGAVVCEIHGGPHGACTSKVSQRYPSRVG